MLKPGSRIKELSAAALLGMAAHLAAAEAVYPLVSMTEPAGGERNGLGVATVDVNGIQSMDALGSPLNHVMFIWVGPFNYVTGYGWDVVLQTVHKASWRDDITMLVTNSALEPGFGIHPGVGDGPGGPTHYSSNGDFVKLPQSVFARAKADGLIRLEFFEIYDDSPGEVDGQWVSGNMFLQTSNPIPYPISPGTVGLFGIAGTWACARSRRKY